MRRQPILRLPIGGAMLFVACTSVMLLRCSAQYEPEGQFWPNSGPVGFGVGAPLAGDDAGANEPTGSADGVTGSGSNIRLEGGSNNSASASGNSGSGGTGSGGTGSGVTSSGGTGSGGTGSGGTGSGGTGSVGTGSGGTGSAAASETCSLSVSVTTTAPGGKYRPRNVGAIWIADSTGRFVKSLDVWGNRRLSHVTAWNAATKAAGVAGNKVDAVTSATLSSHRAHNVSWNCKDYSGQVMPDGTYRVNFEITDAGNNGPNHFESFTKGPTAATVQSSAANFAGIVLTFKP